MTTETQQFSVVLYLDPAAVFEATKSREVTEHWLSREIDDAIASIRRDMDDYGHALLDRYDNVTPSI